MSPIGQTKYHSYKKACKEPKVKIIKAPTRTQLLDRHVSQYGRLTLDDLHRMSFAQNIKKVIQLTQKRLDITLEEIEPNTWVITN